MEWFSEKLRSLSILNDSNRKKDQLLELKIKLSNLPHDDLKQIASNSDFSELFSQLTSNEKECIQETCDILKLLINSLEPGEMCQRYGPQVIQLFSHTDSNVKELILHEVYRTVSDLTKISDLLNNTEILVATADKIGDADLSVAKAAMDVFKKIGESSEGSTILNCDILLRTFARLLSKNDVISFRVYEVIVPIAKSSKEALEASIRSGFLQSLISVLQNDDTLLQLNALEIMTDLALNEDGLSYLEGQGVLDTLAQKIAQAEEIPLSNLLIPGLMKFFGNVAHVRPTEIFSKYFIVVTALFEVIQSDDQTILSTALDTLGHIARSVEGKYALDSLGDSMRCSLIRITEIIQNMPTELRVRALQNLACILHVNKPEQDNRILSLTKKWFDSMCEEPMRLISSLCKQPFADIRQAALEVLVTISSQAWGQQYIAIFPGLIEFLLDRSIEAFKACKETKFNVVVNLSQTEPGIFDAITMQQLKQFVTKGPFYVETSTEVATEGVS